MPTCRRVVQYDDTEMSLLSVRDVLVGAGGCAGASGAPRNDALDADLALPPIRPRLPGTSGLPPHSGEHRSAIHRVLCNTYRKIVA